MTHFSLTIFLAGLVLAVLSPLTANAAELSVHADFEGGSAANVEVDQAQRTIAFTPGGDPQRGWPCWWYFRVDGATAGEAITLRLRGSPATTAEAGPLKKPLSPVWAMPAQATYSTDAGKTWKHTEKGQKEGDVMVYSVVPQGESVLVAWGPPFTPRDAAALVREMAQRIPGGSAEELCRSREGRPCPMLVIRAGSKPARERLGVWVHARQHAWESGSSWVARGFAEFLASDSPDARWLGEHAEIRFVPIMDIDNTATGNGGKDARPQDHNRDWSDQPHWPEVAAAKKQVEEWVAAGRMDLFLDLHNPGPGDPAFFYTLTPELMKPTALPLRDRFVQMAYARISSNKPNFPMSSKPKVHGAEYHPLWKQISANWVNMNGGPRTVSLCLETGWNHSRGTTDGYRAVGLSLGAAAAEFLRTRPAE